MVLTQGYKNVTSSTYTCAGCKVWQIVSDLHSQFTSGGQNSCEGHLHHFSHKAPLEATSSPLTTGHRPLQGWKDRHEFYPLLAAPLPNLSNH